MIITPQDDLRGCLALGRTQCHRNAIVHSPDVPCYGGCLYILAELCQFDYGPDEIPAEVIKADVKTSIAMICDLTGQMWDTEDAYATY